MTEQTYLLPVSRVVTYDVIMALRSSSDIFGGFGMRMAGAAAECP